MNYQRNNSVVYTDQLIRQSIADAFAILQDPRTIQAMSTLANAFVSSLDQQRRQHNPNLSATPAVTLMGRSSRRRSSPEEEAEQQSNIQNHF